jgi:LPXTG-site transpeptidase (sortase) family protein
MWTLRSTQKLLAIGKEIVDGVLRIGGIFVVWFFFMYGNVFTLMVEEITTGSSRPTEDTMLLPSVTQTSRNTSAGASLAELPSLGSWLPTHGVAAVTDRFHAPTLDRYLQNRLAVYQTPFSLLPPGKRLRIHRLWVDAPVVDVEYASAEQMENGEFHDQLSQWVVKYPFTSEPGNVWNTLIFWHSSVDFWETKSNPYGFIFSHLHELEIWDTIELVWDSQQYLYSVEETVIKKPTQINEILQQFKEWKYLTLMACYPRFSTAQRILVVARAITNEEYEKKRLAASTNQVLN